MLSYKKIDPFADTETALFSANGNGYFAGYKKIDPFADTETGSPSAASPFSGATKKSIRLRILKHDLLWLPPLCNRLLQKNRSVCGY